MVSIGILGGGGFLGSHLLAALLSRGDFQVEAVDTTFVKVATSHPQLVLTQGSIDEPGLLAGVVARNQIVVSTTALCNPSLYNTQPAEVIHANFTHLVPLVELCVREQKRLIHFSTCEVYGKTLPAAGLNEDLSPFLLGPVAKERWSYACAKQLLERLLWAHGQHGDLNFTIVRPFNVIGPRMDFIPGIDGEGIPRVLACFMRALLFGEALPLVDGGRQRRSFIYVDDFTEAVLRVIEREAACRGQIINIGNPHNNTRIDELASRLSAVFASGKDVPVRRVEVSAEEFYGAGYDDVVERIPDIDKARSLLNWEPQTSLEQMLAPIVDDYRARYQPQAAGEQ